jgi:signal peptidase I
MTLRWFISGAVRRATDLYKHVRKLLNAQRDLLAPQAVAALESAIGETKAAIKADADDAALQKQMEALEKTATKYIKPYPFAEWRDNVEVFLVAIVVAMGIRTFFLQPFKIPTGSMQPTLYGVMAEDFRQDPAFKMPNFFERAFDVIAFGTIYHQIIAPEDGEITHFGPVESVFHLFNRQTVWVQYRGAGGDVPVTLWCGPAGDDYSNQERAGLRRLAFFRKGEPILCFKEISGDHLFVDRLTYNFRHPARGEIIVFKTKGIEGIPHPGDFYIKRLVGLGGETVSIGEDRHARIDGRPLEGGAPHFENVYSFDPRTEPRESRYSGHVLDSRSLLRTPEDALHVPPGCYCVFGDNTVNSLDSRFWRWLPQENVIGKSSFVYWPFSARFGWGQQ